jgi:hypothetical protein
MEKRVDEPAYKIVDVNAANIDEYDVLCLRCSLIIQSAKKTARLPAENEIASCYLVYKCKTARNCHNR